jgi:hypothetical protein
MSCTIKSGITTDTYTGTLNILTGKGAGKFTDSYYDEAGTYRAVPAKKQNPNTPVSYRTYLVL